MSYMERDNPMKGNVVPDANKKKIEDIAAAGMSIDNKKYLALLAHLVAITLSPLEKPYQRELAMRGLKELHGDLDVEVKVGRNSAWATSG